MIETALLICIVGVVLAVSFPTFVTKMRISKIAEAPLQLGALYRAVAAYYDTPHASRNGSIVGCLPPPAGPTPQKPSAEPIDVDFAADETPGSETWRALRFDPAMPIRYHYTYAPAASGCPAGAPLSASPIILRAGGDLDGDNSYSTFERRVAIDKSGELRPDRLLVVRDRVE